MGGKKAQKRRQITTIITKKVHKWRKYFVCVFERNFLFCLLSDYFLSQKITERKMQKRKNTKHLNENKQQGERERKRLKFMQFFSV